MYSYTSFVLICPLVYFQFKSFLGNKQTRCILTVILFVLQTCFHIGAKFAGVVHMSEPIPVSEEELLSQRYRNDVGKTLFIDSWVHMPIFAHVEGQTHVSELNFVLLTFRVLLKC